MKGVTDIFISKEKLAVFWFLAALACLVVTGWHLHSLAVSNRGSILYVPIDQSFYYLDRSQSSETLNQSLDYHARHALETYLNRGPRGPLNAERLSLLFNEKGMEDVMKDVQETRFDFKNLEVHQMVEIGEVQMEFDNDLSAVTILKGQLIRISVDPVSKETITQSFSFQAEMHWERNPNLRYARRFAWVCNQVAYLLKEISSSESEVKK
ncbi:MAG: hypothetical protein NTV80_00095 [Verrucomicrobia bacterium]|nr:hypothetical protein [Verrucomicrobiota bacterium]